MDGVIAMDGDNNKEPYLSGRHDNFMRGFSDGTAAGFSLGFRAGISESCLPGRVDTDMLEDSLDEDFDTFREGYFKGVRYSFRMGFNHAQAMKDI
jgi:hypothetical protein